MLTAVITPDLIDGYETKNMGAVTGQYISRKSCPLYRALERQHPELAFKDIEGFGHVKGLNDLTIFRPSIQTPWNLDVLYNFVIEEKAEYVINLESV